MKLLFDHNLSARLAKNLATVFPGASHVGSFRLARAADEQVWSFARLNDYAIVTKDSDFSDLSVLRGWPPKVIWMRIGNCTTAEIEMLLRTHAATIEDFINAGTEGTLIIRRHRPGAPS